MSKTSIARGRALVAAALAVFGGAMPIRSGMSPVLRRRPAIVGRRLPFAASDLRLVRSQRVADRGAHVAAGGLAVAPRGRPVAFVGAPISFVALLAFRHGGSVPPNGVIAAWTEASRAPVGGRLSSVPSASWTFAARAESVALLRQAVAEFVADRGIAEPWLSDVRLAVSEAVTNAVVHAFRDRSDAGTVSVNVTVGGGLVEILVRDDGSGMAPRTDSPGLGLGLPLIRRVADGFDYRAPADGGTELWILFELRPTER